MTTTDAGRTTGAPVALRRRDLNDDTRGGGPVDVFDHGFNLVTARTDDAAVVRVIGELDLATAPQLREVLIALAASGGVHVTLDLGELAFIDSSGLSVLVTGLKRLRQSGGDLALRSPNAAAMKVFEITGLTGVLAIGYEVGSDTN